MKLNSLHIALTPLPLSISNPDKIRKAVYVILNSKNNKARAHTLNHIQQGLVYPRNCSYTVKAHLRYKQAVKFSD